MAKKKETTAAEAVNGNTVLQNTYPPDVNYRGGGVHREKHKVRRTVLNEAEFNKVLSPSLKKALVHAGFDWVDRDDDNGFPLNQYHEGSELHFTLIIKQKLNKSKGEDDDAPGQIRIPCKDDSSVADQGSVFEGEDDE